MSTTKKNYFYEIFENHDKAHGRIETRLCELIGNIEWLTEQHPLWENFKCLVGMMDVWPMLLAKLFMEKP